MNLVLFKLGEPIPMAVDKVGNFFQWDGCFALFKHQGGADKTLFQKGSPRSRAPLLHPSQGESWPDKGPCESSRRQGICATASRADERGGRSAKRRPPPLSRGDRNGPDG